MPALRGRTLATLSNIGPDKDTLRLWTGQGQFTYKGNTYEGVVGPNGAFAGISEIEHSLGAPNKRVQANIIVPPEGIREILAFDSGPVVVDIQLIYSKDGGLTWKDAPISVHGFLSSPSFENGVYSCEIETWTGDIDRGFPRLWSEDSQKRRHPDDEAFQFVKQIEAGFDARFPP